MSRGREPDRIARLVRDRPELLARSALLSWAAGLAVAAAEWTIGGGGRAWTLLAFPIFVLTASASVALFQRDPERAGLDALRCGLLAAIPSALLIGWAALRAYETPAAGRVALICMAGATIGAVVGAMAGPVAGWAVRSAARAARGLIRGRPMR